ncbi:putative transferase CAF17, mitochondrial [Asterias rubens]|uniref:putative transferase CAF17, mitochondrial n=1 Tax=Asterias rubens TaxID=7604 RepID=UPI001455690D|nr:putative transferase CAF17, mitochondrial [Asterias rubens]
MTTTSLRKGLLGVFLQKSSSNWLNRCISCHTKQSFSFAATHKKERRCRVGLHRGLHTEKTECIQEKDAPRELKFAQLTGRGLLRISGPDATELLQGLQTNDTGLLWGRNGVMYTMFLNTQGRILFDVICYHMASQDAKEHTYLLECDAEVQGKLAKHLKMFRIRKKVDISSADAELKPWALFNNNFPSQGTEEPAAKNCDGYFADVKDPRVAGFGRRLVLAQDESLTCLVPDATEASVDEYRLHRYRWGVPEGVIDLPQGESLPLESNLEYMNGVSFSKGCYLGQELTARTHYTGVIRKRIMPVEILSHGTSHLETGAKIINEEGKNVGKLRGCHGNHGLALLRVAKCKDKKLLILGEDGSRTELVASVPSWWPQDQEETKD